MNHDHTHNSFKKFVRRRGLAKDSDGDDNRTSSSTPRRTASYYQEHQLPPLLPGTQPLGQPPPQSLPLPQRTLATHAKGSRQSGHRSSHHISRHSSHSTGRSSQSSPPGPAITQGSIRRNRNASQGNASQGSQTPRRRRREDVPSVSPTSETLPKKQYKCEWCNLDFGRKHHKERHVANIHRHVSCDPANERTSCSTRSFYNSFCASA